MENETNTTVEAPVVEGAQAPSEPLTIDDLLALNEEVDPLFKDDAHYTGIKPLHEQIKHLPEATRMNIANLRAQVTRKQQELAKQSSELQSRIQQYESERERLATSPWAQRLSEIANSAPEDVDPWTPEGIEKLIEHRAAQQLEKFLQPLREEVITTQQRAKAEAFVAQNPDVKSDPEIKRGVAELLTSRPELSLEDAYWAVKGKVTAKRQTEAQYAKTVDKQERKSAALKTSTGAAGQSSVKPDFVDRNGKFDPVAAFRYHQQRLAAQKK